MIQAKTNKREFYKNKWIERVPAVQRVSQQRESKSDVKITPHEDWKVCYDPENFDDKVEYEHNQYYEGS